MNQKKDAKDFLTIALPKGRVFQGAVERLLDAGLLSESISDSSRVLIKDDKKTNLRVLILRNYDVPTYIARGIADLGVIGKDVLLEQEQLLYEPLDLLFAPCRLMVAGPIGCKWKEISSMTDLTVATKFPVIAERFFSENGIQARIVHLYGNVEIAPLTGVADIIVDLVDTGKTLKANRLIPIKEIFSSTARLVVNRASMKIKNKNISSFIRKLKRVCKKS